MTAPLRFSGMASAPAWLALLLTACGEAPPPPPPPPADPPTETSPPAGRGSDRLLLPPTGEITTSVSPPPPGNGTAPPAPAPSPGPVAADLGPLMSRLASAQAEALRSARITVHGAWLYRGYSHLSPDPASPLPAHLVAVDLTVEGHTASFDPDDIEIVDGISRVSYGSDPHLTFLRGPGDIISDPAQLPAAPAPLRMLLIYAFPRHTKSFSLVYWHQVLLPKPREFESEGWGLPYPG